MATTIGSVPHTDVGRICGLVVDNLPEIVSWPQLPNRDFRENMYIQYSEGLPCLKLDEQKERIYFDTSNDIYHHLEEFYGKFIEEDVDYFAITETYGAGFHTLHQKLARTRPEALRFVKGQITGPVSFGLTVTDENRRSILYNPELYEAVVKGCLMKARWQVESFRAVHPDVIIFIDEPYLSSFGSAYINVSRESVVEALTEVIDAIHQSGALAGVHCCGNTDWSILMETPTDIINFDAFDYFLGMTLYPEALDAFLRRGGTLAWGIVPTSDKVARLDAQALADMLTEQMERLAGKGFSVSDLAERCLITPSCGLGTLSEELAVRALQLTREVSDLMRRRYFHS